jgi:hypothetical protein
MCEPFVGFASKEKTLHPYQTWSTILVTYFVQMCQTFAGFAKRKEVLLIHAKFGEQSWLEIKTNL